MNGRTASDRGGPKYRRLAPRLPAVSMDFTVLMLVAGWPSQKIQALAAAISRATRGKYLKFMKILI